MLGSVCVCAAAVLLAELAAKLVFESMSEAMLVQLYAVVATAWEVLVGCMRTHVAVVRGQI